MVNPKKMEHWALPLQKLYSKAKVLIFFYVTHPEQVFDHQEFWLSFDSTIFFCIFDDSKTPKPGTLHF